MQTPRQPWVFCTSSRAPASAKSQEAKENEVAINGYELYDLFLSRIRVMAFSNPAIALPTVFFGVFYVLNV